MRGLIKTYDIGLDSAQVAECLGRDPAKFHTYNPTAASEQARDELQLTATELREQYVAKNRPVILRGAASRWASGELWTEAYLRQRCGERTLTVRSAESATFHGEPGYATATLTVNELLDAIGSTSSVGAPLPYAAQVPLRTALRQARPAPHPRRRSASCSPRRATRRSPCSRHPHRSTRHRVGPARTVGRA